MFIGNHKIFNVCIYLYGFKYSYLILIIYKQSYILSIIPIKYL